MDIAYYVKKYKEHEEQRLSTSERNAFWRNYMQRQSYTPKSVSRFEHG